MDKYIKYIFFFVLGIILHLFLKLDLVEGLENSHSKPHHTKYIRNSIGCLGENDCNSKNKLWTEDDLNNYKKKGVIPTSASGVYTSIPCLDGNNYYEKLCFNNNSPDGLPQYTQMDYDTCENKCNEFKECGAYEYNDNGDDTGIPRCCLYKVGYVSLATQDLTNGSGNCYVKPLCDQNNSNIYYSFNQCAYPDPENTDNYKLCPSASGSWAAYKKFDFINNTCNNRGDIPDCGNASGKEICKCYKDGAAETTNHVCEQTSCDKGSCSGIYYADSMRCDYGLGNIITKNDKQYLHYDSDIIMDDCFCGSEIHTNITTNDNNPEQIINEDDLPLKCGSTQTTKKYCNLNAECTVLDECNASSTLLTKSCKYLGPNGSYVMCKFTNASGHKNTVYNPEGLCNKQYYKTCAVNSILDETCLCVFDNFEVECNKGQQCSASGCNSLKCPNGSAPLNGSKCPPEPCLYYSKTNASSLNASCSCGVDENNLPFDHSCPVGSYCFDDSYTQKGCKKLPPPCDNSNELLSASCICSHDTRNNGLFNCPKGNYCLEKSGCKTIKPDECPKDKIDSTGKCCPVGKQYDATVGKCSEINPNAYNIISNFIDKIEQFFEDL